MYAHCSAAEDVAPLFGLHEFIEADTADSSTVYDLDRAEELLKEKYSEDADHLAAWNHMQAELNAVVGGGHPLINSSFIRSKPGMLNELWSTHVLRRTS